MGDDGRAAQSVPVIRPGVVLEDRFVVRALLGEGSFGRVYRAVDRRDGRRHVAVKAIREEFNGSADLLQRFEREAEICAQLVHPDTARLLHVGDTGGADPVPYLVFELVHGLSLRVILDARGKVSVEEAIHVCAGVLGSLGEAHELGILHRDIKPGNVILVAPEDTWRAPYDPLSLAGRVGVPPASDPLWRDLSALPVKLCDFGLAKPLPIGGRTIDALTAANCVPGTTNYMSPEQTLGKKDIDHRSDLYAVAMLLYRMLSGGSPYGGRSPPDTAWAHVTEPIPPLSEPWRDHPVAAVYARAAAKKPRGRYGSAAELAWALRSAVDPALTGQEPPPFPPPPSVELPRRGLLRRLLRR